MLASVNNFSEKIAIMSQSHLKKTLLIFISLLCTVAYANEEKRIVTLGGAATEAVFALGAGQQVVAVDLSSTYPPKVRELPQVGYIRNISPEGVLSLEPELVITTESLGPPAAKAMMKRVDVPVLWLPEPDGLEALKTSLESVAERLGRPEAAQAIIAEVEAQIDTAQKRAETWPDAPRVLFLMQPPSASRPGMVAGKNTRAQRLIELAGGKNAIEGVNTYQPISSEAILQSNPDVILVGISPGHGATEASVEALKSLSLLQPVTAFKHEAIYGVPMDDLNFGPRLGEAVKRWNGLIAPPDASKE